MHLKPIALKPIVQSLITAGFLVASLSQVSISIANDTPTVPQWPHAQYANTPTIQDVLGYQATSRISSPEQIVTYFEALAQAHPDRIKLFTYGTTWEGRRLFYVAISSANNIAKLDEHQASYTALAEPRKTTPAQAKKIIEGLPGSIWIGASVHGNEISPAEATLVTAYHLLANQDQETKRLLDNTIVYLDPLQNPDGRARFVSRYYQTVGLVDNGDRLSAEHNEPWPNGRTNHYLFDLNRDWYVLTQPETQGRVKAFQQTRPLYFIDSHEMGGDSTYFFAPSAEPLNPNVTPTQRENLVNLGKNNGKWFDTFGYDYFTAEIFDLFYPGYGGNWPNYSGSLASTYEQASSRGVRFVRSDGSLLHYGDTVQQNFVAYISSIETVANNRKELLDNFYEYRKSGIEKGRQRNETQWYIFPNTRDAAGHQRLASVLTEQGIEVQQATADFKACGVQYQKGAYIIDSAQPSHHLIRTVLKPTVELEKDFIARQEERRANNLRPEIYDTTAWSLPHLYNLELDECSKAVKVATTDVQPIRILPGSILDGDHSYGYIVRWGDANSGRLLSAVLRQGLTVRSANEAFEHQDGRKFEAGSFVLPHAGNPEDLTEVLAQLALTTGAVIEPLANSWIVKGPSIGSNQFKALHASNVAILWDEPTSVLSAGSTRYILEREFDYPVTALRADKLRGSDLSNYDVIILPASARPDAYNHALGNAGRENLRDWVRKGGVLVTLGNATRFAVSGDQPLLASELIPGTKADKKTPVDRVPGIIANTQVDTNHWLTAGLPKELTIDYRGQDVFAPLPITKGRNVIHFEEGSKLLAGGYLWEENREHIAHSPYVLAQPEQRGLVIGFTQEPNLRAYQHGQYVLLLNAVLRSSAQKLPVY